MTILFKHAIFKSFICNCRDLPLNQAARQDVNQAARQDVNQAARQYVNQAEGQYVNQATRQDVNPEEDTVYYSSMDEEYARRLPSPAKR